MSQTIIKYLINKLNTQISEETSRIDSKILELVKLRSKKQLKKAHDNENRQREIDSLTKQIEFMIKELWQKQNKK